MTRRLAEQKKRPGSSTAAESLSEYSIQSYVVFATLSMIVLDFLWFFFIKNFNNTRGALLYPNLDFWLKNTDWTFSY